MERKAMVCFELTYEERRYQFCVPDKTTYGEAFAAADHFRSLILNELNEQRKKELEQNAEAPVETEQKKESNE